MTMHKEHNYNYYLEIDPWLDPRWNIKYPIKYIRFDIIEESVYELYSEISSWETNGYVSNYQIVVV